MILAETQALLNEDKRYPQSNKIMVVLLNNEKKMTGQQLIQLVP